MRKRVRLAAIACLAVAAVACARPPWSHSTLYDDLGGEKGIARIVSAFMTRLAGDPIASPFFAHTNMDRFETLLNEHFCMISGGPCQYTGDSMRDVHRGHGISDAAFTALVQDLEMAMDDIRIPFYVQNRLLARLTPFHDEIVEGDPCSPFAWSSASRDRCEKVRAMQTSAAH